MLRALTALLDEWLPVIPGSEINDDPLAPLSAFGQQRVHEEGDAMPIRWLPRVQDPPRGEGTRPSCAAEPRPAKGKGVHIRAPGTPPKQASQHPDIAGISEFSPQFITCG